MAIEAIEITLGSPGLSQSYQQREGVWMVVHVATRKFRVTGTEGLTSFLTDILTLGNGYGVIPALGTNLTQLQGGSLVMRAKRYELSVVEPYVNDVTVVYDDDPSTEPDFYWNLKDDWSWRTTMSTRMTYVDINGNPIYVYRPVKAQPGAAGAFGALPGAAEAAVNLVQAIVEAQDGKKAASVKQMLPMVEGTINLTKTVGNETYFFDYVGTINSAAFKKFSPGMLLCTGATATPILYRDIGNRTKTPIVYRVSITILSAGPEKAVTTTLGQPVKKKEGWDQLAYWVDSRDHFVPRIGGIVNNAANPAPALSNASEVVVPTYEKKNFADFK